MYDICYIIDIGDRIMGYRNITTDFDVMKEIFIQGCELSGEYGFPVLSKVNCNPKDTVDFRESFSRKIKNWRELSINFYIDDFKFNSCFNNPLKYLEHFSCFHSLLSFDFSMSIHAPMAINIWNNYRNHVLDYFYSSQGITVVPDANILPEMFWDWCWDGLPKHSTLCCCTNGRVKNPEIRLDFCRQFKEMERRLEPYRIIIVGREIPELEAECEVVYLQSRNMQIQNEIFG